ncbi:MAG TPA: glycerol-3-phosphate acyltransferase [Anaerolineales bacterium]|nr:glycerol-3-phosphate acyltransferase [Anaerolineales bacterium]
MMLTSLLVILLAYALGCIAVGYYLVRWRTGQDLHELGSGATGGRNTGRVLGRKGAIATGLGDILKGVLAMAIALWFKLEPWALALVMIAVLVGHIWPVQLGFKGGKGLSAAFGAVLMYDYRIALVTAVLALSLLFISRRNELFFLAGIACCPLIALALGQRLELVIGMVVLVLIILFAHRENIQKSLKPAS